MCETVCSEDGTYMWMVQVVEPNGGLATPLVTDSGSLMPMPSLARDGYVVVDAVHGLALVVSIGQRFLTTSMDLTRLHQPDFMALFIQPSS